MPACVIIIPFLIWHPEEYKEGKRMLNEKDETKKCKEENEKIKNKK